jgi:glycosyltransferase involved in cell wall biosynthesis
MNIAIISHSAGGGGAERVAVNLANHLLNENEVFFCAVHSDRREYYLDPKVQYDYIGTERSGFRGQLSIAINLRKYIKKNNIEVMISLDISVEGIFLIGNKKLFKIYSLRNDPTKVFNSGLKKILSNLVYWDADKIVFQTPDARDYFCQKIREHGVLIPNPVKSGLPYWNEENHRKEVVAACRMAKQKNLFMLLDAYRIVWEKRQLSIYGEGELKEALVRYAEQLGISEAVKFHGFSSEIHKIMAESAIYVSSSDYEGISNSMLEALAIGIPAICTDCPVGGARMYIRDGENGYLVPVGDADVMADRMLALMEDKKLGESFSKESVKIREELTDDRIFGMWKALLVR